MQDQPSHIFKEQESRFTDEAQKLDQKYRQLSFFRIISFAIALILLFYLANERLDWAVVALVVLFPPFFFWLIIRHKRIKFARDMSRLQATINTEELLRLQNKLKGFPDGMQYFKPLHPYHLDLDIFGPHSLFQLINRTASLSGEQLLARWLSKAAPISTIKERQEAVQELSPQISWRQTSRQQEGILRKPTATPNHCWNGLKRRKGSATILSTGWPFIFFRLSAYCFCWASFFLT